MSSSASNILATPSRDRVALPTSQSTSLTPSHRPSQTVTNTPIPSLISLSSSTPVTIETLLAHHASASDPTKAALEQAVQDRNVLSSQNSQLWKLIEKQRTAYNNLLKENDRIRGERDVLKSKLQSAPQDSAKKRDKEKDRDRTLGHATSNPTLLSSREPSTESGHSKVPSAQGKDHSDESADRGTSSPNASGASSTINTSPARPLTPRSRSDDTDLQKPHIFTLTPLPEIPSDRLTNPWSLPNASSPKHSHSPLVVQARADPSPEPVNPQPHSESPSTRFPALNNESVGTGPYIPNYSSIASAPVLPLQARKSHPQLHAETDLSAHPADHKPSSPSILVTNLNESFQPSHSHSHSQPNSTSSPSSHIYHQSSQSLPQNDSTLQAPSPSPSPSSAKPAHTPSPVATTLMLPEFTPRQLSRESRVSIPYEARQYIASMESPGVSPSVDKDFTMATALVPVPPSSSASSLRLGEAAAPSSSSLSLSLPTSTSDPPPQYSDSPNMHMEEPAFVVPMPRTTSLSLHADESSLAPSRGPSRTDTPSDFLELETDEGVDDGVEMEGYTVVLAADKGRHAQAQTQTQPQHQHQQQPPPQPPQPRSTRPPHLQVPPGLGLEQTLAATAAAVVAPPSPSSQAGAVAAVAGATPASPTMSAETATSTPPIPGNKAASFRALPLLPHDLPTTQIQVTHSTIRPNDRGREVLSFIVQVDPGNGGKEPWRVEKLYSDVLGLDQRIRASVGKGVVKKMGSLPEGKLWRDHAPAKADQRKAALESYLQSLINLPIKNKDEVIAFFTSDIVREALKPVARAGYKEGYLTKKGKNFGGWKTRYFVLQGPVLEYFESRGGTHLGSIQITGAQIGRQQRGVDRAEGEKEYRHAFLVIEAKRSPSGGHRHVLCAESDEERDAWVEELVRYVMGSYNEDGEKLPSVGSVVGPLAAVATMSDASRVSTSSWDSGATQASGGRRQPVRSMSKDEPPLKSLGIEIAKGSAMPISQLPQDAMNAKLHNTPNIVDLADSISVRDSPTDGVNAKRILYGPHGAGASGGIGGTEIPLSSSLPNQSPLDTHPGEHLDFNQRSNSELGHYTDALHTNGHSRHASPDRRPREQRKSYHPSLHPVASSSSSSSPSSLLVDRATTPDPPAHSSAPSSTPSRGDSNGKVKISGPLNGTPIPAGYKFEKKPQPEASPSSDRKEKAKSRSFWNFGRPYDKAPVVTHIPRAVFGATLEEAVEVAEIDNLPAIVYRCIQYLEAKKADQEEGIYRLSGSTAVIKSLKDRFNMEGDVDLLAPDEFWDPHAIAGLLKCFLRELPASILTRELHLRFLAVIDFVDPQERINELSQLIKSLPLVNFSLLRALTAHLILIVQNSPTNKMTMRNVGIVFSPTLGIPAGVFSLMLGEFNRVFNVDSAGAGGEDFAMEQHPQQQQQTPRQVHYQKPADKSSVDPKMLIALSEEPPSDSDGYITEDSTDVIAESSSSVSPDFQKQSDQPATQTHPPPPLPDTAASPPEVSITPETRRTKSRASQVAATRGLNIMSPERVSRHSRMAGLPASPRPQPSPMVQRMEVAGSSGLGQSLQ